MHVSVPKTPVGEADSPSELGVRTGRLRSGVEEPPLPLAYNVGEGCWLAYCRFKLSCVFKRDEDFVAEKLEKMFFESFRGLGEAGDSGMLWNGAFGDANSGMLGDRGLWGLMGALLFSFPAGLDRMASDRVDDLGILRTCLRGWCCLRWWCYCRLSATRVEYCTGVPAAARGRGTSARGRSSQMASKYGRARGRSREGSVAGGWGAEGLSEYDTWVAAGAGTRWGTVALSTRLCLLPMLSASAGHGEAAGKVQRDKGRGRWYEP